MTPAVTGLNCPNCGAPLVRRGFEHSVSIVCENCHSVLDAKDPNLRILQQFEAQTPIRPLIPLGTRGKIRGDVYEAIGFQVRTITVEGTPYSWSEYLLFNPYKGFRYLTEYQGHWNDVTVLRNLPEVDTSGQRPVARLLGERYRHFQTAQAVTTYVLGEFPWQVHVGESATVMDFVAPPRMLSSETTPSETVWSLGEYTPGARVWEMFKLPGKPPAAVGVFENQPSPLQGGVKGIWLLCLLLLLSLLALSQIFDIFAGKEEVFRASYVAQPPGRGGETSFVTQPFDLKGRTSAVEVSIHTDAENNWVYLNLALIDLDTGQAFDFGREVSYYYGVDGGESWSEGGATDRALLPSVPSGRYYLRVEPEMDPAARPVSYQIAIRRDVPAWSFFWIAALLLLVPPAFLSFRALSFEQRRWTESDYGPPIKSGGGDD
jgi:hypothetical protein